jgi:putative addiction module antidote
MPPPDELSTGPIQPIVITSVLTGGHMLQLKVRKVGNSLGVTLPAQAIRELKVAEGDELYLTEAPGGFRITPYNPEFADAMKAAEAFMARYRNALRELAK